VAVCTRYPTRIGSSREWRMASVPAYLAGSRSRAPNFERIVSVFDIVCSKFGPWT
jgi:hypothetical protein